MMDGWERSMVHAHPQASCQDATLDVQDKISPTSKDPGKVSLR